MDVLIIGVLALLVIAGATSLGNRTGIATPLILVILGVAVSLLPIVPDLHIEPEWILAGVLPPLLYSASVSMPTMDFRREFGAIGGLSIALVIVSSIVLGLLFAWFIPGLGLWWGIALGAIVSPTDAVATSIVKGTGASPRVITILEGESMLNDASALVLLRTAIAAAAASFSFWGALGTFAYAVAIAVAIGGAVGVLNLLLRARVRDATVNTVISFAVPFVASIPVEVLGASGLVAAVTAGLITGHGAVRRLSPQHRLSDSQNWRTVELVLEGAVFLLMGLELATVVHDVEQDHAGVGVAAAIAAVALLVTLVVRAGYVTSLLASLRSRAQRSALLKPRMETLNQRLIEGDDSELIARGPARLQTPRRLDLIRTRVRRTLADVDYLLAEPLGWRDGAIVVWAGMRGAITLAAAQTLPSDTPHRSLLVLIAFLVAAGSLVIQGGTLPTVAGWLRPPRPDAAEQDAAERERLMLLMKDAAETVPPAEPRPETPTREQFDAIHREEKARRLAMIAAQRSALLEARDDGIFSSDALRNALAVLDADQISLELKGGPAS